MEWNISGIQDYVDTIADLKSRRGNIMAYELANASVKSICFNKSVFN